MVDLGSRCMPETAYYLDRQNVVLTSSSFVIQISLLQKMGGAVSAGHDHDDLIDKLKTANYVKTPSVEEVYRAVDRAFYFLPECQDTAYKDLAWKKGNIHLSAPCIYAEVLESLLLKPGLSFLNLGSGTGYLSTIVGLVLGPYGVNHGVELYEDVVEYANSRLIEFKKSAPALDCYELCEPHFVKGNSLLMGSEVRQYDRVYCGAACPENHENYMKNLLKVGGVLVMPLNDKLMQVTRKSETTWESKSVLSVSFSTLQLPQPNSSSPDKIVTLPEINPLTLQEICRSVIRSLLRKKAKEEHADIAIRRRKYYRNKRRRMLPNLIIPILDSSDDEGDYGRNNIYVPAGGRGYRFATHAIAPRLREGDDGFAVEDEAEVEQEPANGTGEAGASSSRSARATAQPMNQDNDDEIEEDLDSQEDDDDDSSTGVCSPKTAKREKVDSGVGADLEGSGDLDGVEPNPDYAPDSTPPFVSLESDSNDSSSGGDAKMEVESEDSETPGSQRKSPHIDDSSDVPLYSEVMREKIMALSLPPTLKSFLNYDRPF
ncbi:hypothetical protein GE061_002448 [Apolygus lucorum]|uniref:Protein-L-isoaspartate O-methyltransferase domain-containing protein 1 n=1 Tax=Apolygus lucorum TaxID=248454 RepID=A0A8S9X6W3_APOLU|nr:hypothetical protein GE061_002448 [Apolygus lucorum]